MASNVTRKKILLADSEEDFAKALHARLKSNGYEVVIAVDGVEAFLKAKKEKPDLVIYAVRISKRCNLDLLRDLRSSARTRTIPVLILTSVPEQAEEAVRSGAASYLMKPYEAGPFLNMVKDILP